MTIIMDIQRINNRIAYLEKHQDIGDNALELILLPIFKLLTLDSIYIMKAFLITMELGKE